MKQYLGLLHVYASVARLPIPVGEALPLLEELSPLYWFRERVDEHVLSGLVFHHEF